MFITTEERKVYHLDSYLTNMCKQGITPELPWTRLAFPFPRLHCLSNKSPNLSCSKNYALWVLEWMQMKHSFVNTLYGVVGVFNRQLQT